MCSAKGAGSLVEQLHTGGHSYAEVVRETMTMSGLTNDVPETWFPSCYADPLIGGSMEDECPHCGSTGTQSNQYLKKCNNPECGRYW